MIALYILLEILVGFVGFGVLANLTGNYEGLACRIWMFSAMAVIAATTLWGAGRLMG